MSAVYLKLGFGFIYKVNCFLFSCDRGCGLNNSIKHDGHTVTDATVDATVIVTLCEN